MLRDEVIERIRAFFTAGDEGHEPPPADDANLFDLGVLDSLRIVSLLVLVEAEFGIVLDYDDLTEENLGSIDSITDLIVRRSTAPGSPAVAPDKPA